MRNVSNERIYYELRARHRRTVAKLGLELALFALVFYQLHRLFGGNLTLSLTFVAGFGAALAYSWLVANEQAGPVRKWIETVTGPTDWPADLKRGLEERGEL